MEYGKQIVGNTLIIPEEMLTESVPGQIYQLQIGTNGISDPQQAINLLITKIPEKFPDAKVLWARIDGDTIRMQVEGSPFPWAALLLFLPQILLITGIAVTLIAVYLVIGEVPSWAWAILAVGGILILFSPQIGETLYKSLGIKRQR